ncbi:hypothetical protein LINPERHAP2_LOCUS16044 [Linum perenne]
MVINIDGAVDLSSKSASVGGMIRDSLGRCFEAFSCNLGIFSVIKAELRGILMGLQRVWSSGYRKV